MTARRRSRTASVVNFLPRGQKSTALKRLVLQRFRAACAIFDHRCIRIAQHGTAWHTRCQNGRRFFPRFLHFSSFFRLARGVQYYIDVAAVATIGPQEIGGPAQSGREGREMACPTCSHTMHGMGCKVTGSTFYWCPRCGTIKPCEEEAVQPALVGRLKDYQAGLYGRCALHAREWERLGIAESIK